MRYFLKIGRMTCIQKCLYLSKEHKNCWWRIPLKQLFCFVISLIGASFHCLKPTGHTSGPSSNGLDFPSSRRILEHLLLVFLIIGNFSYLPCMLLIATKTANLILQMSWPLSIFFYYLSMWAVIYRLESRDALLWLGLRWMIVALYSYIHWNNHLKLIWIERERWRQEKKKNLLENHWAVKRQTGLSSLCRTHFFLWIMLCWPVTFSNILLLLSAWIMSESAIFFQRHVVDGTVRSVLWEYCERCELSIHCFSQVGPLWRC